MAEPVVVFVYGTLMRGRSNHRLLVRLGAQFVAPATTQEKRVLVNLGPYPAMVAEPSGDSPVAGEVWALPSSEALLALDAFEGSQYQRTRIVVMAPEAIEAYVYVLA